MKLEEIFTEKYLLTSTPISERYYFWSLLGFFSLLIIIAIAVRLMKGWDIKVRLRQFYCFFTCGLLGLLYIFASYERLAWLGSRLFLALDALTLIVWIVFVVIWMNKYMKKIDNRIIIEERYGKYLPKKKKK